MGRGLMVCHRDHPAPLSTQTIPDLKGRVIPLHRCGHCHFGCRRHVGGDGLKASLPSTGPPWHSLKVVRSVPRAIERSMDSPDKPEPFPPTTSQSQRAVEIFRVAALRVVFPTIILVIAAVVLNGAACPPPCPAGTSRCRNHESGECCDQRPGSGYECLKFECEPECPKGATRCDEVGDCCDLSPQSGFSCNGMNCKPDCPDGSSRCPGIGGECCNEGDNSPYECIGYKCLPKCDASRCWDTGECCDLTVSTCDGLRCSVTPPCPNGSTRCPGTPRVSGDCCDLSPGSGYFCVGAFCEPACPNGTTRCPSHVDLNLPDCCDQRPRSGYQCIEGECEVSCTGGLTRCEGTGECCDQRPGSGFECAGVRCELPCTAGFTRCERIGDCCDTRVNSGFLCEGHVCKRGFRDDDPVA
jgi:hypothetical protein